MTGGMHTHSTFKERRTAVLSKISYPPMRKKCEKSEPLSSELSRRCLEIYHNAVEKDRQLRSQLTVQSSAASRRPLTSASANLLSEGDRAVSMGRPGEALSCFLEAVRMGESSPDLYAKIAALFRVKGQTAEAIDYYTKAIVLDPCKEDHYLSRAECYLEIESFAEAYAEFEKFFKLTDAPKPLLVRCGKAALDANLLPEAEKYLTLALHKGGAADKQTEAYAWYNLGELAERRGQDDIAKENYRKVCESDPTFPQPYKDEAEEAFAAGDFPFALHLFEAVAKMKPEDPAIFTRLAEVYSQLGSEYSVSVLSCLTRAIELSIPGDRMLEVVLVRRGRLLMEAGDPQSETKAIADFTFCLDINPNNADALESRGMSLYARNEPGDVEAAVADFTLFVSLPVENRRKGYPYRCLAVRAYEQREYAEASRYFAFAGVCGGLGDADAVMALAAMAHVASQTDNFEEHYEPRPTQVKEQEKGGKKAVEPIKPYPVVSLSYHLIDSAYVALREREPTVHSEMEYHFIQTWRPYRENIEKQKEEAEALRSGKKGKKK
jgi:tetratricopeptide (TPR) repeat protein